MYRSTREPIAIRVSAQRQSLRVLQGSKNSSNNPPLGEGKRGLPEERAGGWAHEKASSNVAVAAIWTKALELVEPGGPYGLG